MSELLFNESCCREFLDESVLLTTGEAEMLRLNFARDFRSLPGASSMGVDALIYDGMKWLCGMGLKTRGDVVDCLKFGADKVLLWNLLCRWDGWKCNGALR